jgi:hypothetical protein
VCGQALAQFFAVERFFLRRGFADFGTFTVREPGHGRAVAFQLGLILAFDQTTLDGEFALRVDKDESPGLSDLLGIPRFGTLRKSLYGAIGGIECLFEPFSFLIRFLVAALARVVLFREVVTVGDQLFQFAFFLAGIVARRRCEPSEALISE